MGVLAHVVPKTPPRKMCQKPHPEKNRFHWKSQGQIFQECVECQGQIPRSNNSGMCGMSRSNFPRSNGKPQLKLEKTGFNWKNRKNGK